MSGDVSEDAGYEGMRNRAARFLRYPEVLKSSWIKPELCARGRQKPALKFLQRLGMVSVTVCEVPQKLYIFQTPNDIEAQKES